MERLRAVTGQINFCLKFSAVCVEVWKKRGLPCRLDLFVVYRAEAQKQLAVGRRIALNLVVKKRELQHQFEWGFLGNLIPVPFASSSATVDGLVL